MTAQSPHSGVGTHIRRHVLPAGMTVSEAAKRLGVSRPTLSKVLNGRAALSPQMALRLERAFGADHEELLDLQAKAEQHHRREHGKTVPVGAYVPSFLVIKARQIAAWSSTDLNARRELPVLLRKLVHSTGSELRQVDFPGYDSAERKGWDGLIEAETATPWVPKGRSGWEFGTDKEPARKANKDYAARLASIPARERAQTTFVFVTPQPWPGKSDWAKEKHASGEWKAVMALDGSDLEQWLETSVPAQMWLAAKLGLPAEDYETLDECWDRWSSASEPRMTDEIFRPSIAAHCATLEKWLKAPSDRPLVVAADSKDEALAFLACLFREAESPAQSDLVAVFHSPHPLRTLAASTSPFLPVACTDDVERELANLKGARHCIAVRHRNAVHSNPGIALDLLGDVEFETAIVSMGLDRNQADTLARESGRSPTILRRRLATVNAIRIPRWAQDAETAQTLIPMALIGAWHAQSEADREVVSTLSDAPYEAAEAGIARLLQIDESPVWSAGQYRGVTSKIDALFGIGRFITEKQLRDYLLLAEYVLSESDPALDLPEDQRWAASIYKKVRDHSSVLREGICETLVILEVHGNALFHQRLGMDISSSVSGLVRRLLTPLTVEKLLSHEFDLPRYAEAAPQVFLSILEKDTKQPDPVIQGLLRPAAPPILGRCSRTGLLWALECLAWNRQHLSRVSALLAQLSQTTIDDNWVNKPIASLQAIYRSWMPQTAAPSAERIRALEALCRDHPQIGWRVCVDQVQVGTRVAHGSYRPRWRNDASGAGHVVSRGESLDFTRQVLRIVLAWPRHDETTLGDLVERIRGMSDDDSTTVWGLVEIWSKSADDRAKAELRERIRRFAFTRRGLRRGLGQEVRDRAREAYTQLTPNNPVLRHAWLFADAWVQESADEFHDEDYDFAKRQEYINQLRLEAIDEIWSAKGIEGPLALLVDSRAPQLVGTYTGLQLVDSDSVIGVVRTCLAKPRDGKLDSFAQGLIHSIGEDVRQTVLRTMAEEVSTDHTARLFTYAPMRSQTWRLLDTQSNEVRDKYWREVTPQWVGFTDAELTELIDRLLEAGRPRAAFRTVHLEWARVETGRLKRLLMAVAKSADNPSDRFQPDAYDISAALDSLGDRSGVTQADMAQLEFVFLHALDHSEHGIPNLERQIAESPAAFAHFVALAYRRQDPGEDPLECQIEDPERRAAVSFAAHHLLGEAARLPGTDEVGDIDTNALHEWLSQARELCEKLGRGDLGDQCIGQLLSKCPPDSDGPWPRRPVCDALESLASEHVGRGFHVGVLNGRGVYRGTQGDQERELASRYRGWARQLAIEFPHVSATLEMIATSYDRQADLENLEAQVDRHVRR